MMVPAPFWEEAHQEMVQQNAGTWMEMFCVHIAHLTAKHAMQTVMNVFAKM
jgi:hypothetical protein